MKETTYFKTFLRHSEKIDLLKAIDAANFEELNKIKRYILQIKFQRNAGCNIYPQELPCRLFLFFFCLFLFSFLFFSVCAFMRKLLVDCSLESIALL